MNEPIWLDEKILKILHLEQLQQFGGLAGIRDEGLLLSALARAQNRWAYSAPKPDVIALAASHAFGIAKNHPFFDGNKRTSLIACQMFLQQNGLTLVAPQPDQVQIILGLASGEIGEPELEAWIRPRVRPN
ncbi:MAG: type II toxin-antitoxin system death-on-curing family toxin [Planctomycetaceae bacterium]|nr:type II toxin-antitoxin system death-on-curing family toxin [Planctomycetaceae bacterium]